MMNIILERSDIFPKFNYWFFNQFVHNEHITTFDFAASDTSTLLNISISVVYTLMVQNTGCASTVSRHFVRYMV